jgi:hypothetical protein
MCQMQQVSPGLSPTSLYVRHPGEGRGPANALKESGIPAFAGMTVGVVGLILGGRETLSHLI